MAASITTTSVASVTTASVTTIQDSSTAGLFMRHLAFIGPDDTFASLFNKIIALDYADFSGEFSPIFANALKTIN